jgi:RNA-directed DNA polymerase
VTDIQEIGMSLPPPFKVEKLQTALHTKAKNSPDYRFYALYDKLYRRDILGWAFLRCLQNGGAPGVDGQSFADIEAYGEDRWLDELTEELRSGTYRPQPVRRVFIPKGDGKLRPLGIPCIKDRVAQMAAVLVLGPIFEADLEPEQHAYRSERNALDAVDQVKRLIRTGHTEVVDADLSGYFDSIPHSELMKSASRRISDGRMLRLLKMWLETPVEETDDYGNRRRTTRNKDQGMGTPQGSPISPLLSNIYMRRFVKGWKTGGHEKHLAAKIVNYADDFVICCRGTADEAMTVMRGMMSKLKLTVNETKTRLCLLPDDSFDFLGYTLGRNYDCRTGESYLGPRPSRKKIDRLCREIGELTTRKKAGCDVEAQVKRINRKLKGWSNYFRLGTVSKAYRTVDSHVRHRVRQWLCAKFKVPGHGRRRFSDQYLHQTLGLYQLQRTKEQLFVGERVKQNMKYSLVRKPGAGKPHAGFDERDVETESW